MTKLCSALNSLNRGPQCRSPGGFVAGRRRLSGIPVLRRLMFMKSLSNFDEYARRLGVA
jgi:hypothetical protein